MGVQSRTLLNSIAGDLMRVFRNTWTENCGKLSEKNMWGSSLLLEVHEYSLQPTGLVARIWSTAYWTRCTNIVYSLPDCTTDALWECLEYKGCSKISKFPKKSLRKSAFFSNATALQSRIFDISQCRLQEKCFLLVFWNSWKFARERSILKSFD